MLLAGSFLQQKFLSNSNSQVALDHVSIGGLVITDIVVLTLVYVAERRRVKWQNVAGSIC